MASRPSQHDPSARSGRGPDPGPEIEREARAALGAADPPPDLGDPDLAPNAHTVLERRYFVRDADGALVENARQLFWRVATHVAKGSIACGSTVEEALAVARDY
jgi:hypothetical protein